MIGLDWIVSVTMQRDLLEQGLSRQERQDLQNKRTALLIFQLSWIMAFVCISVVSLDLRSLTTAWPPAGVPRLDVIIPTLMTLALIASSVFVRRGVKALQAGQTEGLLTNWRYAIGLGTLFVVVMTIEWIVIPYSGRYSDVFRLMVGFHGVHALVIGYYLWRVYRNAQDGRYGPSYFWPVEGGAGLWHFVTVAWILFYLVLYIV